MKKITVEFTEAELKVVASALRYTKAYKGIETYQVVLENIINQLTYGIDKYHVVQGILNDGISSYPKNVIVKAKNAEHAAKIAKAKLESAACETYSILNVGEATKDYSIYEVI